MSKTKVALRRDEQTLMVPAEMPGIEEILTITYREQNPRTRKTEWKKKRAYQLTDWDDGCRYYFTHQGFWKEVADHLNKLGYDCQMEYAGTFRDKPDPDRARHMLMPYQRPVFYKAMWQHRGGLIGAPTRFGKAYLLTAVIKSYPKMKTVVTVPGTDLCRQLYDHCRNMLGDHREIRGLWTGGPHRVQGDDITVCSIDSLDKCDEEGTKLLLVDEPHAAVSETRLSKIAGFTNARRYGFGATLDGRYDQKDRLIVGLLGPVLASVSYTEAVAMGAISPLKVAMITLPFSFDDVPGNPRRETVFKMLLGQNRKFAALVRRILTEAVPDDWQTMMFIENEDQAEFFLANGVPNTEYTVAMAKKLPNKKEREALTDAIAAGEYLRVLASRIYIQGLTFPDLKLLINLAGGGPTTGAIQKPGRLLQKRPGKRYGLMVDFLPRCTDGHLDERRNQPYRGFEAQGKQRLKLYKKIGYDVVSVENMEHLKSLVDNAYETN